MTPQPAYLKRAAAANRAAQAARNEAATRSSAAPEPKAVAPVEVPKVLSVAFASKSAAELAAASKLDDSHFTGCKPTSRNGYTTADVRAIVASVSARARGYETK